ncbi:CMP/dCMP deaminase zinc-binding protein [Alcanivorax sp. 521-1]|uniref:CMP/dCMP deaminase zinc-binding protein n=1 Tax=Alloalcanivorax profundimaris TaxID=2735259 RepID=A0ABS0APX5_9GAMM|nr:nucleoside deaminase [Alloalcanivorax profundimaris]MBF5056138.1 CMP/dCMP deaminase zinc-binding protein [Alloalcanivorax profundimaris]
MRRNNLPDSAPKALDHDHYLRLAFAVARRAMEEGGHPFGALLAGPDGEILMEQTNAFLPDQDMTGHAERVIMTRASTTYPPAFLASCTLYSSAEPCAMCAGAAYWAGVGRVVYGLSEKRLKGLTGDHPENPTLDLPCRRVFECGQRDVDVIGPLLEDEAAKLHQAFWARH